MQNRTTKFYNMIRTLLLAVWLMFMLAPASLAVEKEKIKVACIGNSITFGAGLSNQARDSYPAVLGQMLGSGYDVRNFGVSGTTVLSSGDSPYINTRVYKQVLDFQPDIIFIKFGTNDSKGGNWKHKDEFKGDMQAMIDVFSSPSRENLICSF